MVRVLDRLEGVIGRGRIRHGESLAEHTILQVAGVAEYYVELDNTEELIRLVKKAWELDVPVYLLGSGSSIQSAHQTIEGLIIKNSCRWFDKASMRGTIKENKLGVRDVLVSAHSGAIMNQLVRFTIEEGLAGLEYQLGLPGTVGGAIYTNAKYKHNAVKDFLHSIRILSKDGDVQTYTRELPYFVQLESEWESTQDIIISAVFKLMPEDQSILWERGKEAGEYRNGNNKYKITNNK